jgi:hypothetical protein
MLLEMYDPRCLSRIPDLYPGSAFFFHPGSAPRGEKRHRGSRIRIRKTGYHKRSFLVFFFSASYEPSMLDIRIENPLRQIIAPAKLRGVLCYVKLSFCFQRVVRAVHAGHQDREPAAANDCFCQAYRRVPLC